MYSPQIVSCSILSLCFVVFFVGAGLSDPLTGWATYYTVASTQTERWHDQVPVTASGRVFREDIFACALPLKTRKAWNMRFGQRLRVTNLETGAMVIVILNDIGPSERTGNAIDLTPAAFMAIGGKLLTGKVKVKLEKI